MNLKATGLDATPAGAKSAMFWVPGSERFMHSEGVGPERRPVEHGAKAIRILLIEDELQLATSLRDALKVEGFVTDHSTTGAEGLELGLTEAYDAAILDLGLPDMSGLSVLQAWRRAGRDLPVIILSARASWPERVSGLNSGADDYMAKPFEPEEVAARLWALIRRSHGRSDPVLRHGGLELRPSEHVVRVAGQEVELTAQERRILTYLLQRPGRIVSETQLADHIYDLDRSPISNGIQVSVGRLRRKLGKDVIQTVRGMGYKLR
jgi:two-component system OmpR family response regulator